MELYYSFMLYRNSTTAISLENLQDFMRLFWKVASKAIAKGKNTFSVGVELNIIFSIDVIFICLLGNDLKKRK